MPRYSQSNQSGILFVSLALMAVLSSCRDGDDFAGSVDEQGGAGEGGQGVGAVGGFAGAGGADECSTNVIDLELTISPEGVADSQVIPVQYEGVEAYLAIDTGAPITFIFGQPGGPEYVEHIGDVTVGCEQYPVSSLVLDAIGPEPFNGREIIGILGMDFFSEVPTELDYPGRKVVRHLDQIVPMDDLTVLPVEWNGERVLVDASLDQVPVRLIYDAGSAHTIWVGQDGQPGDEQILLGTADGGTCPVYEGSALLRLSDEERSIPIWRAPSFPYVEEELEDLGAQGLLGATGIGFRRIVFHLGVSCMLVGPRVTRSP